MRIDKDPETGQLYGGIFRIQGLLGSISSEPRLFPSTYIPAAA